MLRNIYCQFETQAKQYAYYTEDDSIQVGDYVIVISPGNYSPPHMRSDALSGGHPAIVRVASVREDVEAVERASKPIVAKIDLTPIISAIQAEEKRKVLLAKIKKAEKAARERLELERLRDLSPELSALLDELKAL